MASEMTTTFIDIKQHDFSVCIASEFAQRVAIAFKANKDVDDAIKECLYGKDEDEVYRCALWDITEDNEHIVTQPKEENFIDGGSLGPLLGENWITSKMFLTWDPLYTIIVCGMDGHIWVGFYDYERNEIGKVRVHKDI
ncbi:hypothetical protein KJ359_012089 [Pestalotiopsis sp. 9143b]|nr:hypothetical protein KJ359_012089 [Pestalotiopsis sp. 9143b]